MHTEEVKRETSRTTYTIRGSLEEVLGRITALLDTYHPMGYGTAVRYVTYRHGHGEPGAYEALVTRANSCD